ncbi:MAG: cytochrome c-type biogenesis protein CcmH [Sphingomonadaceae bacterium]|nr:cytochrome c-type biogenesis protein CcmH [Sphingomonadaceae bacterium]
MALAARLMAVAILYAALPVAVHAQSGLPPAPYAYRQLDDPVQEAAARNLMAELRCLVCQGQSIADSDAPLAGDMRSDVRERIAAGQRPAEIRQWLIDRYGNWVTYDPPIEGDTIALYILPLLALLGGLFIVIRRLRPAKQGDGAP